MSRRRTGVDTTKRTDTEQAQRRMDELFRALIENASDVITILDAEGIIRYASPFVERVLGYKPHELIGTHIAELLHPDDLSKSLESYAAMRAGVRSGTPEIRQITEERLRHKDGSWRVLEGTAKVLDTPSGAGIVINSRDITERKRADQQLHESEERYRSLVEAAPDVIYTVSAEDGLLTSLNPAFETLTGWSRAEWLGKPMMGIVHPDDLPRAVETFQKASRGETQPPYELRVLSKSGEYLVGEFTSTPHVKDGKFVGELGIARDITERKRVEEALRDTEKRFRLLFERAPLSYQSLDENGCFIDVNPAWLALFGYTREEVIGRWFGDFMTPESAEAVKKNFPRFKAAGEIYGLEYEMVRKDGSHFIASVSGKIGYDEQGRFAQTHCILADITEPRRAEEALKKSASLLRDTGEMAKVGGWELDLSTKEVSWTEQVSRIHRVGPGYKPELEEAMNFYAPESRPALGEALKKAAETGEPYDLESLFIPSGSKDKIWVRSLGRAVYSGGEIVKLTGTFQNIDKYKRAEEALRESEEKHRTLFETMAQGVVHQNAEGYIISANPAAERLLGLTLAQMLGRTSMDPRWKAIHEDGSDFPGDAHPAMIALKTGKEVSHVVMGVLHPGANEYVWINIHAVPQFRPGETKPYQVYSTFDDITGRKRAAAALAESEERFRSLVENATVGIYRTTPDGHILMANPALVRMLGFDSFEELAGRNLECEGFESSCPRSVFRERIEREGQVIGLEVAWIRRDGSVILVRESARAVRADDGRVLHYDGIVEDITTRRHAEGALRRLSGRLLRLQDEERRRIARQLHETAAQGLAGLAVNLTIVKTSAADLSPRASACLSESLELAEQCSREIRTISYLLHPPLVDEAGLAPALGWYTAGFAQRSGIEAHVDVSPEFGRLPSELELTLYRIVQEALTNIHRHSGSKTARICLERRPNEIVLTVADEGHGFPSAALGIAGPESADIGVGIPGMRERLRQLGGRLHIQTGSRGTTLTAILPLGQVTNGQTTLPFWWMIMTWFVGACGPSWKHRQGGRCAERRQRGAKQ
jgi:PAS domain S-box-containing protein